MLTILLYAVMLIAMKFSCFEYVALLGLAEIIATVMKIEWELNDMKEGEK